MKNQSIKIKAEIEKPIGVEILERDICEIATSMRKINSLRISRKAIVALIKDHSGIPKGTIEIVLNNLEMLEQIWLKKKS